MEGILTNDPVAIQNHLQGIEVFVRGTDNGVHHIWQDRPGGNWSGWEALGLPGGFAVTGNVAVSRDVNGWLEIFVRGANNALWHKWQDPPNGQWSGWESLGGILTSDPVVIQNHWNGREVFVRGTDNGVHHIWQDRPRGNWSGWEGLGLPGGFAVTGNVAVSRDNNGWLEIFVRGANNALWHKWQDPPNGQWSGWESLGGILTSDPVVIQNHWNGREVFVRGTDNGVHHIWQDRPRGNWSGWEALGGYVNGNISVSRRMKQTPSGLIDTGWLDIFVRDIHDNSLRHRLQSGPSGEWSEWHDLGGILTSNIAVQNNAYDGRREILGRGTDNKLYHTISNGYWLPFPENQKMPTILKGFTDLHCHLMAHLGFGGKLFWGQPDGVPDKALGWCTPFHGLGGTGFQIAVPSFLQPFITPGEFNLFINMVEGSFGHLVGGYPEFDGWPKFTSRTHQQMYIDWLKRAYDGGLRLIVALAVNQELFGQIFGGDPLPSDEFQLRVQIEEIKKFVNRHSDFMEIAYSSTDAKRILKKDKLVVVLGTEVDYLNGWRTPHDTSCNEITIKEYLKKLYAIGVRHIFPIHMTNNAFGGCAIYRSETDLLAQVEGMRGGRSKLFTKLAPETGVEYGVFELPYNMVVGAGRVNANGLNDKGKFAIKEMMKLGMIIDIDHMSELSVNDTLTIAEELKCPVIAGHTAFRELAWTRNETKDSAKLRNEFHRTAEQIERMKKLGGMVAIGISQYDCRDMSESSIKNDCAGSTKTWVQQYFYALKKMERKNVGLATDFNGFAGSSGPRFGTFAVVHQTHGEGDKIRGTINKEDFIKNQMEKQTNGVKYSGPIIDPRYYRFLSTEYYSIAERDVWEAIAIYKFALAKFGLIERNW